MGRPLDGYLLRKEWSVNGETELQDRWEGRLMVNRKSNRAAVVIPTSSKVTDSGAIIPRVALVRPVVRTKQTVAELEITGDVSDGLCEQLKAAGCFTSSENRAKCIVVKLRCN
jgi:hypothetical protein